MFDKKILCLGNNSQDTDDRVSKLADTLGTINHGLVSSIDSNLERPGLYHTTVVDLEPAEIISLSSKVDSYLLLDQSVDDYSNPNLLYNTFRIFQILKEQGTTVEYQNPESVAALNFFSSLLDSNPAFCIYPFMHLVEQEGNATVCSRSSHPIKPVSEIKDWKTDTDYQKIRNNMLAGEKMPEHCRSCYNLEKNGKEKGVRYHDTLLWISNLKIKSISDLQNIEHPKYVEVRTSNRCNLRCRTCSPRYSHKLEKEFKILNLPFTKWPKYSTFDMVDLDSIHTLYVTGGEPTISAEFYAFLRKCIKEGRTDIKMMVNTNGATISDRLFDLFAHFPNLGFTGSLDGVGLVNDYIRTDSNFDQVVENLKKLRNQGHHLAFISVLSIYNVDKLGDLFLFFDREFDKCPIQLQYGFIFDNLTDAKNRPDIDRCIESMEICKTTKVYYNHSRGVKSIVDNVLDHYNASPIVDRDRLERFFKYNDGLDSLRNIRLEDYLPELAKCRSFINK